MNRPPNTNLRFPRTPDALALAALAVAALLTLAGCERKAPLADAFPEPFGAETSCAADGMLLAAHPGPKGQIVHTDGTRLYYCDVREVFEALYDPEQRHLVAKAFVQPVEDHGWAAHPDGWAPVDGLVYVLGSRKMGHMGPTLVPFRQRAAAEAFMAEHGGRLLPAAELTEAAVAAYVQEAREALRAMQLAPGGTQGMGNMHGGAGHEGRTTDKAMQSH